MLKEAWEILLMVRTDSQHNNNNKNKRRRRSNCTFGTHSKNITVLPSADSAVARQKGQPKASTVQRQSATNHRFSAY
jgi:hypothetical protein